MKVKLKWRRLGGHIHVYIYTTFAVNYVFNGELIFTPAEWGEFQEMGNWIIEKAEAREEADHA